ncbi:MAG TPA: hypothetical protein VI636_11790 [Candidatus Angelobacter sp.]
MLKTFCNELARLATTEDGAKVLGLLRSTNLFEAPDEASQKATALGTNTSPGVTSSDEVGIWKRKERSNHFVRRLDKFSEWSLWANIGKIGPKERKKRVILIGESVARGYLYEPQYTPAMVLEAILERQLGKSGAEVIDLARISLGMEVKKLAMSALLLDPDAVVIFSGNNWGPAHSRCDLPYLATSLQQEGIPGLKRLMEQRFQQNITQLIEDIASRYQESGIPLVWIVPEFNLGDWRDPISNAPHLLNNGNRDWSVCRERVQMALQEGDIAAASVSARKMIEIDQGITPATFYLLAECSRRAGDMEAQRLHLESARDALRWDPNVKAPRPYSVTQTAMREQAAKYKNEIVDLPLLFKEYLKGGLPDRRLFLDYCHLTAEGIQIAMAAAAAGVLRSLKRANVPWRALANHGLEPTPRIKAEALFLAAVHNAHWYQSYELVHDHCVRALEFYPGIARVMACFIDLQTQCAPMLMSRAAEELTALQMPSINHYLLRVNNQNLDKLLLDAILASLKKIGIDATEGLEKRRRLEHSVTIAGRDLLDYYYCSGFDRPQESMLVTPDRSVRRQGHYRAHSAESSFFFIAEARCPVRLKLTCRLPHSAAFQEHVSIEVNRVYHNKILVGREWGTWDITLAGEAARDGINEIVICWPTPDFSGQQAIAMAASEMLQGQVPEFYSSFGEIHSFTVSDARMLQNGPQVIRTAVPELAVGQA